MKVFQIALSVPLRRSFDYSAGDLAGGENRVGCRVLVPFGRQQKKTGVIIGESNSSSVPRQKLKEIISVIDEEPVLSKDDLKLLYWAADYYHHPVGEVIFNALPSALRNAASASEKLSWGWVLSDLGQASSVESLKRAPKQSSILALLRQQEKPMLTGDIEERIPNSRSPLLALEEKGLLVRRDIARQLSASSGEKTEIVLKPEQRSAHEEILKSVNKNEVFLLDGITGSGKTEVYISVLKEIIAAGKQALVLSPEIGLTPQLVDRIRTQTSASLCVLHSGLNDSERLQAWHDARSGRADIIIGTRSAIWTPVKNLSLIVVDEEHDLSYKQQDGLKYSARDLAIIRARFATCPVILGSATPSLESLQNSRVGKYRRLELRHRAGNTAQPVVSVIDLRNLVLEGALSRPLVTAIESELAAGRQAMLFLNRRGYAPALMCHHCAWLARCERCDRNMTFHKSDQRLSCHHCQGSTRIVHECPECQNTDLVEVGHGTERLEETLARLFPDARIARVDRDTTRRKGAIDSVLEEIKNGDIDILIGTQMLAKGHHFPGLGLVGIVDVDGGLCSVDFRASERMAQLFVQVSGRAGRESNQGSVVLQTHFPEHPQLLSLIKNGYHAFADAVLSEREQSALPPYSYFALFRSEGVRKDTQLRFLEKVAGQLKKFAGQVQVYGPFPAPMEKRAGKFRMQLLVLSENRPSLGKKMGKLCREIEAWPESRQVRWSIDIDPQDML